MQACLSLVAVYYAMYLVGWLANLRAKVDLEGTNPPDYARKAFFGATAIIYVQAFQSFVISMLKNCMPDSAKCLVVFQNVLTFCCTIGVYGCIVAIFYSICTLTKTASE